MGGRLYLSTAAERKRIESCPCEGLQWELSMVSDCLNDEFTGIFDRLYM